MKTNNDYLNFLEKKQKKHIQSGFEVDEKQLNNLMFPFQKFIVKRALKAGKYAIFADCGLGKTLMQLEWANQVNKHTNKPVLILAPLAVVGQTKQEGIKFGINMDNIHVNNYEQLENIDFNIYSGIVLDESSILKNYEGSTKKLIIDLFKKTPYKLACTATPSPNDPMELGNHSEFLDVMNRNEMLAMYFVHDGGETAKWRLKGHAVKLFYQFVGSWSIMLNKPQDIGFEMNGYDLPKLNLIENQIVTSKRNNGSLFNDAIISATNFNQELRLTKIERLDEVVKIINSKANENFIIWIKQNEEGELLKKLLPESKEVKGNDSNEWKEKTLLGFANNEFRILITKTKIASFGMNYQNCRNQIFASLDFSFEGLYQAIRRSYRFGQKNEVNIYLITTDTMSNVNEAINKKQKQFEIMQNEMSNAVNANLQNKLMTSATFDNTEEKNEWYKIKRGDSVQLITELENESIGLSVFSPPFAELYTYSSHVEDMGNSKDYNEFLIQFGFLIKEIYRVMKQGRNVCVHCMDLPIQKGKEGFIGLRDFSGMILKAFEDAGFIYASRVTIWKDPVVEMQRTKALGLLHKQVKKDSTMSRVGIPDYVMIFRKDGERNEPVTNKNISVDLWQKIASPVWMDIDYGNTLQGYRNGRDENDEKHICPLQLETIERLILLYSNENDTVFTPFMGIGSEIFQAVKMNRKGIGFELKESYYDLAKKNLKSLVETKNQITLF
ncbi:MAG: DNA methyltransferase [bacterium]|jgi:DNA modification methylase